jgi:hypothetical protein
LLLLPGILIQKTERERERGGERERKRDREIERERERERKRERGFLLPLLLLPIVRQQVTDWNP